VKAPIDVALIVLLSAQAGGVPPTPTPRSPVSQAQADSLAHKLLALQGPRAGTGKVPPQSVVVTEGEINSYVNLDVLPGLPPSVRDVELRFERGRLSLTAVVDIDDVKQRMGSTNSWSALSFFSGRVPVNVSGRYDGPEDGFGRVTVEEVYAGRVPIPVAVLE